MTNDDPMVGAWAWFNGFLCGLIAAGLVAAGLFVWLAFR